MNETNEQHLFNALKEAVEDYCLEHCCMLEDYPFQCSRLKNDFTSQPCKAQKWLEVLDKVYQQKEQK